MLAAMFVYAGMVKLLDIPTFAVGLGDYGIVYDSLVTPAAWLLAFAELLTGLALAIHLRGSFFAALAFLVLFITVLSYGVWMGLDIDCGCFGPSYHASLKTQLIIDLGLVVWWAVVYAGHQRYGITAVSPRALKSWVLNR